MGLRTFTQKMINSGHKQHYVKKVMISWIPMLKRKLKKGFNVDTKYDKQGFDKPNEMMTLIERVWAYLCLIN